MPGILYKLLREHLTQDGASGLTADTHILCWGYNDGLVQDSKEGTGECVCISLAPEWNFFAPAGPRSIAFDGKYIYLTSSSLKHLLKLGSGKQGTLKGLVYASEEMCPGWLVHADGRLLHHKLSREGGPFCRVISKDTLQVSAGGERGEGHPSHHFSLSV